MVKKKKNYEPMAPRTRCQIYCSTKVRRYAKIMDAIIEALVRIDYKGKPLKIVIDPA